MYTGPRRTGEARGTAASTLGPVAPRPSGSRLAPAMAAVEARWPQRHRVLRWPRHLQGSTGKGCPTEDSALLSTTAKALPRPQGPDLVRMEQRPRGRVPGPSPARSPVLPWSSGAELSARRKEGKHCRGGRCRGEDGSPGALRGGAVLWGSCCPGRPSSSQDLSSSHQVPVALRAQGPSQLPRGPRHLVWKPIPGWVPQKSPLSGWSSLPLLGPHAGQELGQGSGPGPGLGGCTCTPPSWV